MVYMHKWAVVSFLAIGDFSSNQHASFEININPQLSRMVVYVSLKYFVI